MRDDLIHPGEEYAIAETAYQYGEYSTEAIRALALGRGPERMGRADVPWRFRLLEIGRHEGTGKVVQRATRGVFATWAAYEQASALVKRVNGHLPSGVSAAISWEPDGTPQVYVRFTNWQLFTRLIGRLTED